MLSLWDSAEVLRWEELPSEARKRFLTQYARIVIRVVRASTKSGYAAPTQSKSKMKESDDE